ncbi:hypothetical protein JQ621_21935 [Bradyrhizobium manausense]|nr:hypothetical protein [Bradyrhizobium manausense]MBR1090133.1 hypothetical protein [Bradyrhizobium manausense]
MAKVLEAHTDGGLSDQVQGARSAKTTPCTVQIIEEIYAVLIFHFPNIV